MYFQTSYMFMPGLQCYDARRIVDLQHYAYMMEKHQRVCVVDPFEPIRRLAMSESRSRNPDKPLTSFRISDILSGDREKCKLKKKNDTAEAFGEIRKHKQDFEHEKGTSSKRLRVDSVERDRGVSDNERDDQSPRPIVRPWNASPKYSPEKNEKYVKNFRLNEQSRSTLEQSVSPGDNSNSANSFTSEESRKPNKHLKQLPKLCHSAEKYESDSNAEEEIDVEACEEEDSDVSVIHTDKGDISPLDALVAMSSKTFMGLESFGKQYIIIRSSLTYQIFCTIIQQTKKNAQ